MKYNKYYFPIPTLLLLVLFTFGFFFTITLPFPIGFPFFILDFPNNNLGKIMLFRDGILFCPSVSSCPVHTITKEVSRTR